VSDEKEDKLDKLYELSLCHGRDLGKLEGRFASLDGTMAAMASYLEESRDQYVETRDELAGLRGSVNILERGVDSLNANLEVVRSHQTDQGVKIATIENSCYKHGVESQKRDGKISSLWKAIKLTDDTGVHHIAEEQARIKAEKIIEMSRWTLVKTIAACIVGAVSLMSMVISIMNSLK
jgi:chromosome segregation ATPase